MRCAGSSSKALLMSNPTFIFYTQQQQQLELKHSRLPACTSAPLPAPLHTNLGRRGTSSNGGLISPLCLASHGAADVTGAHGCALQCRQAAEMRAGWMVHHTHTCLWNIGQALVDRHGCLPLWHVATYPQCQRDGQAASAAAGIADGCALDAALCSMSVGGKRALQGLAHTVRNDPTCCHSVCHNESRTIKQAVVWAPTRC